MRLQAAASEQGAFVTATDMTHTYADLRLMGPAAAEVLSLACGLDFRPAAFPNLAARSSSVARTRQLILRRDFGPLPAYQLVGDQSLAAYLWGVLMEAGRGAGLRPVGVEALRVLEEG
jgi:heterotetrameric sarcosine oxidase gamma subunit